MDSIKSLDCFLRALERAKNFKKNHFIYNKITTANTKFPVIHKIEITVDYVKNLCSERICTVDYTFNSDTESEEDVMEKLLTAVMENILKFYGI